jgi:hypothetical protein
MEQLQFKPQLRKSQYDVDPKVKWNSETYLQSLKAKQEEKRKQYEVR